MKLVAVLLYPGCIFLEIAAAVELLAKHARVQYFTPDGGPHVSSNGACMMAVGSYADLAVLTMDAVLLPGGNPDSIMELRLANECLQAAYAKGAVLAGICAGALVIAASGLLAGRRATHTYTAEFALSQLVNFVAPLWQGVIYERANAVRDGRLITAQPWAVFEFAALIGEALGLLGKEERAKYLAYYQQGSLV
ncbi:DJ-1/PfpI family protein [Iodobacter fluviatilis]|uniref:DJ-1/PfpI family protein n=1 Tax=Iodobacter fluviatilis TaxID=537 RepID=A0A377Q337_9NEIS|nr:DJ-1/PfpI family protein [Iodobacter fluviatilis]TCU90113.1 DJ-1/PfpI family protein [Iodobacter fluviatilis]STQ89140.1 transcriptional activator FtrA [Iodobacter fluviatilis]